MKSLKEQYRRGESRVSPEGSNPQRTEESSSERGGERRASGQEYDGRVVDHEGRPVSEDSDVTLDVPSLKVEELNLDVENLRHRTSMQAELADMVKLNVGVETNLDGAKLEAKGIDAQMFLKAKLDNVRAILSQTLDTIDNNPQILQDIARIAEETAGTGERALEGPAGSIGETIEGPAGRIGETPDQESEDRDTGEPDATSAARRMAEELGIDLSQVEGTGSGGRILVRDVTEAAK
jgi:pyruvate/2-oxoglutarate dehydrogenase complex dihydrolipoamide acyltransferase (E2) component